MDNGIGGMVYLKTPSGVFKVLEVVFSLCAFISALAADVSWNYSTHAFFCVAALIALLYALLILVLSILNIMTDFPMGPKIDVTLCILLSILMFSSAALYTNSLNSASLTAAVVFQYLNGFSFLGNTLHKVLQ